MSRKKGSFLSVVLIILASIFLLPLLVRTLKKDETKETYILLDVYETTMTYDGGLGMLGLTEGVVKTNQQVDKIFVNINGYGAMYLDFEASLVRTDEGQYIAHYIPQAHNICNIGFDGPTTLTVDTYIEYGGRSYKVDTQKVYVKSGWTEKFY